MESETRAAPPPAVSPHSLSFVAALLLIWLHFAGLYDAEQSLATDSRYYTHFAFEIAEGAVPHRDFFGNKTQFTALWAGFQVAVAQGLGWDGLTVLRVVSLATAALGALLLFAFHRRLQTGDEVAAWLGFLPILGFGYIGALPVTGPVPKLLMAVAATGAALLVARRRWFAAGLVSAIAPIDWQIGLFACLGVFVAALLDARPRRALAQSVSAVALVGLAFLLYFAVHGALEVMLAQTVGASFARGAEAGGPLFKFAGIRTRLAMNAPGEGALLFCGLVGSILLPFWLRAQRFAAGRPALVVLAIYHYGVVAFSLIDFQGSGDTMLLLHSFAFFAGITLASGWLLLAAVRPGWVSTTPPRLAAVLLVLLLVRPVVRMPPPIDTPDAPAGVTLEDQRTIAKRLRAVVGDETLLVLGPTEMLVLEPLNHVTLFHFWNDATRYEFARTRESRGEDLLSELVDEVKPAYIVANRLLSFSQAIPYRGVDLGSSGRYSLRLFERVGDAADAGETPGPAG